MYSVAYLTFLKKGTRKFANYSWTVGYILEKVNYQTLILMLSDAPRYVRRSAADSKVPQSGGGEVDPEAAAREAGDIVNFYQSNLEL